MFFHHSVGGEVSSNFVTLRLCFDFNAAAEVYRQTALLERGKLVQQETRGFDEDKAETYSLRSKEDAPDYRYMPDPNLPPLLLSKVSFWPEKLLANEFKVHIGLCR